MMGFALGSTHPTPWFDACPIGEPDPVEIGRDNAWRLFKLNGA